MKANELMIGDWVRLTLTQNPTTVTAINGNSIDTKAVHPLRYDEIEPIPLTEKLLLANGFEFTEADKLINVRRSMFHLSRMNSEYKYVSKTKKGFVIDCAIVGYSDSHKEWEIVQMFGKDMVIDAGNVNSVHELQQAMRLCGIEKEIIVKEATP